MDARKSDIDELVARLSTLDPYKIVLFSSHTAGEHYEGSDIDLLF